MPIATISFDLSDPEDVVPFNRFNKSSDMAAALHQISLNLCKRLQHKYEGEVLDTEYVINEVFIAIDGELEERGIIIDELI